MRNELRTRSSVKEGITGATYCPGISVIEYQPGNGTRYVFVLTDLSVLSTCAPASRITGKSGRQTLVWCQNYGKGWLATQESTDLVHYVYVQKQLGCSILDAVVIAEFVGSLLHRPFISVDEFLREKTGS